MGTQQPENLPGRHQPSPRERGLANSDIPLIDGLVAVGRTLASAAPLAERLNHLCRVVAGLLGSDRSSIFVLDGKRYRGIANFGNPPDVAALFPDHRVSRRDPLIAEAVRLGSVVVVNDALKSDLMNRETARLARIGAIAVAPMYGRTGEALGFLTAEFNENPGVFDDSSARLVLGFAGLASAAVVADEADRARLLDQERLRERERFLSDSQRVAEIGSWKIDLPPWQVTWSDETYRVYRVSPDSFVPSMESLIGLLHPDDRGTMEEWARACEAGEKPSDIEFRAIHPDGSIRIINGRGELELAGTNPVRMIGTAQDITERKRAEEALRRTESSLEHAQAQAHLGSWEIDLATQTAEWSREMFRIYGLDPAGPLPTVSEFFKLIARDDTDRLVEVSRRALEQDEPIEAEFRTVPIRGETRHLLTTFARSLDSTGRVTRLTGTAWHFTDRKKAEGALAESERKLRLHVQNTPVAVIEWDTGFCVTRWNPAAERIFGYSAAEAIGQHADLIVSEGIQPVVDAVFAALRERSGGERSTHENLTKDGRVVVCDWFNTPLTSADGTVIGVASLVQDVTESRRAEEALRESEERFRSTFEQAGVGIAHIAPDGRRLRVNQKLCDIVGYASEELLQMSFQDLTEPDNLATDVEGQRRLLAGEIATYSVEKRYIRKDGSRVWANLTASLVRDPAGEPDYFISVVEDISRRKEADETMRLQAVALQSAANAILITDRYGVIQWINTALTATTGYTEEDAVGRNALDLLMSGVNEQESYAAVLDTLQAGKVWQGELMNRRKDGSLYPEEQTITPVRDDGGEITHFVGVARDITERKRLEAELQQAQKMESMGQLAGGIAHDFNNLLSVINGTAVLFAEQLRSDDPLREALDEIREAADRGAALTRQLLAFSRKQILQPKVLDLGELVLGVEGMLRRLIGEDVDLTVGRPEGACNVKADPGQLEQVILNLAVNARDAMPTGGALTIETEAVDLEKAETAVSGALEPGAYVVLTVRDAGTGMGDATRLRIFEPFFTTKEVGKGTGLGLSTVQGIVQQSAGGIQVDTEPGKGTTFRIYLPRVAQVAPEALAGPTDGRPLAGETILVVEDYPALRRLAVRFLQSAGYNVLEAGDGEEALQVLERHQGPVHLLVTDVVMPGMSGRVLAERAAEVRPEIRVIFTSGYTDDDLLLRGVQAEGAHFVAKPYTREALEGAVRTVLGALVEKPR